MEKKKRIRNEKHKTESDHDMIRGIGNTKYICKEEVGSTWVAKNRWRCAVIGIRRFRRGIVYAQKRG